MKSKEYLSYIHTLPCIICGATPVQAHHLLRTPDEIDEEEACFLIPKKHGRGMGRKSGDEWAIPLCPRHHAELHANGDETRYLQQMGIDGVKAAEKIFKKYKKSIYKSKNFVYNKIIN